MNFPVNSSASKSVLTKRPNPENQRKCTISLSMREFLDLVQGQVSTVEIYDSSNRLKTTLTRESLLEKAIISPYISHEASCAIYLVNYSECV